ncbi:MAG: MFS transporter [Desulfobacula sp.]|uniref:MFS transporter n=1 Tax=Desulfobacula sp. TaxID=2593537 RepID=UPI001DCD0C06|nr:MFS transporter [Desulfobacula sp.]MBT4508667.1 MFS transporter [Desulfobacula sp.]MBT5544881.1 MFS transporter [Desulfobacula sp.]MBT5970578.1 MFS transporter [Desulfobacula sp.]MBT7050006.1 MFS transporter [Desulfobacula sp.]
MKIVGLKTNERKIFGLHILYSIIEGVLFGVMVLNEFVFVKSLKGTEMQLAILFQASVIVFVFTIVIHELLKRYKKKTILRMTALITRLPLLLMIFFPRELLSADDMIFYHYFFLVIFLFYFLAMPIVYPIINSILKNNYTNSHFGALYSYAAMTNKIVMMLTTFVFGWILDIDPFSFVYVYPAIGILGIISLFLLSFAVKVDYLQTGKKILSITESLRKSFRDMKTIIKSNKPYRDFELGFMLYGFSFMLTIAVITLFLVEKLNLNYTSIAFYKNSYNLIAILLLPFFGKLIDRIDPRKFAAFTFLTLLMHLFFMGLTEYYPYYFDIGAYRFYYLVVISFAWNGLFAATMSLLWNIGSAYFCKDGDAGTYQSVHLSMVGIRAMIAPLFGIWLYQYIGFSGVFALGVLLLTLSIIVMFWSLKRDKLVA